MLELSIGVGDTMLGYWTASSILRRERGRRQSARREKLHRHTAINLRTSGYYFNSELSGLVSSEKRRPLSQPAGQKEKWPSDLIYERTNERTARPWDFSLLMLVRTIPPLLSSRPSLARFVFAHRICDGGTTTHSNSGLFLGESRSELIQFIKHLWRSNIDCSEFPIAVCIKLL